MSMFCFQCQETAQGKGCTKQGVCGKPAQVANLQDLFIYALKGVSAISLKAEEKGIKQDEANSFILTGLFSTITNVNFKDDYFVSKIQKALELRDRLKNEVDESEWASAVSLQDALTWTSSSVTEFEQKAKDIGVLATENEDVRSLRQLITYGLKGLAAYVEHACVLGYKDDAINSFIKKALVATLDDSLSADELTALVLETGKNGVAGMALLDKANATTYGTPEITTVPIGVKDNPGILISGHDLKDLEELLEQTKGSGVDVYTHGEMLPAHYYPPFKKYDNFVGNYGNAWWQQKTEFESFNGPILLTTNCLIPPKETYIGRLYTTGLVGYPGVKHIPDRAPGKMKDFSAIIAQAKQCPPPQEIEKGEIVGGFAHATVLSLAEKVVDAVKSGAIKRFIVMAGCDGRMKSRIYFTEFAKALPQDTVILTAGCAKYRYNKLDLGDIGGIPRVLDAGQCNDSYSLAVIALKLKEVFELNDINELPISYNIGWYEQKSVIVLLGLLYLGIKNIHLGPTLPAFLSPNVADLLVQNFGIAGITTVEDDLKVML